VTIVSKDLIESCLLGSNLGQFTLKSRPGYGHISPKTGIGRAATLCYAIFGIPLCLMVLFDLGKVLKGGFRFLWTFVIRLLRCPNV